MSYDEHFQKHKAFAKQKADEAKDQEAAATDQRRKVAKVAADLLRDIITPELEQLRDSLKNNGYKALLLGEVAPVSGTNIGLALSAKLEFQVPLQYMIKVAADLDNSAFEALLLPVVNPKQTLTNAMIPFEGLSRDVVKAVFSDMLEKIWKTK